MLVVPALVYLLGQTAQSAMTSSIVIVGVTAVAGALSRLRGGLVDLRTGLAFGAVGVPSAYLGTRLNHQVPQHVLLLAFAALTVLAAATMLLNDGAERGAPPPAGAAVPEAQAVLTGRAVPAGRAGLTDRAALTDRATTVDRAADPALTDRATTVDSPASRAASRSRGDLARRVGKIVSCGLAVGFLIGGSSCPSRWPPSPARWPASGSPTGSPARR